MFSDAEKYLSIIIRDNLLLIPHPLCVCVRACVRACVCLCVCFLVLVLFCFIFDSELIFLFWIACPRAGYEKRYCLDYLLVPLHM